VSTVIYTNRCNFRCPFCHNPDLALDRGTEVIRSEEFLKTISARLGFIDGVVITGGEPTLQWDLEGFTTEIRKTGMLVKLDTNGSHPEVLERLLADRRLDFIAMDIKTSRGKYKMAAGVDVDINRLDRSIELIKESGIDFEFRTTCVPSLVDENDIMEISRLVGKQGCYTLQQFQPKVTLDTGYSGVVPYHYDKLHGFLEIARKNTKSCRLIGLR
jgi:pyruvate formate lyase activating enzyme